MEQSVIRGLGNAAGENNCFLNSVLQVLWSVRPFRARVLALESHSCSQACITCSLKILFTHLQHAEERVIQPQILREALAFSEFGRFGLTQMSDASECFTAIMESLHKSSLKGPQEIGCLAPACIAHEFFGINISSQTQCSCGFMSEPIISFEFLEYLQASALCDVKAENPSRTFAEVLLIATKDNLKRCEGSGCGRSTVNTRWLLNEPKVLTLGLSWESGRPDSTQITDLLITIDETIHLRQWFTTDSSSVLNLCSMVCYYGMHYVVYIWKQGKWYLFSDEHVHTIGSSFSDHVITHCIANTYQPVLLVYENKRALYPREKAEGSSQLPQAAAAQQQVQPAPSLTASAPRQPFHSTRPAVREEAQRYAYTPYRPDAFPSVAPSYVPPPYSPAYGMTSDSSHHQRRERIVVPLQTTAGHPNLVHMAHPAMYPGYDGRQQGVASSMPAPYPAAFSSALSGPSSLAHGPDSALQMGLQSSSVHFSQGFSSSTTAARSDFQVPPRLNMSQHCLSCRRPNDSSNSNYCRACWQKASDRTL